MNILAQLLTGRDLQASYGPTDDYWYQPVGGAMTPSGVRVDTDGAQMASGWFRGRDILATVAAILPFPLLQRLGLVPYFVGINCGPRGLRKMLERAGFDVIEVGAALHCPRVLAVPLCRFAQRYASPIQKERLLRLLMWFERLSKGPLRFLTGHYVTVRAKKIPALTSGVIGVSLGIPGVHFQNAPTLVSRTRVGRSVDW